MSDFQEIAESTRDKFCSLITKRLAELGAVGKSGALKTGGVDISTTGDVSVSACAEALWLEDNVAWVRTRFETEDASYSGDEHVSSLSMDAMYNILETLTSRH